MGGNESDGETRRGGLKLERESTTDDQTACLVSCGPLLFPKVSDVIEGDGHDGLGVSSSSGGEMWVHRSNERFERVFK